MEQRQKRQNRRKLLSSAITFEDLTVLNNYSVVISTGNVIDASIDGFLVELDRTNVSDELRDQISLDQLMGCHVALHLPQMGLDLDGFVMRTQHKGKGIFNIYIEFSSEVPDYWRDCLVELLPSDEDLEDMSYAS